MTHPCFLDQPSKNDDAIRETDQSVNDPCGTFSADGQFLEPTVVPGVGSFYHPSRPSLQRFTFGTDDVAAPQLIEQVTGFLAVVASIQMRGDLLWKKVGEA